MSDCRIHRVRIGKVTPKHSTMVSDRAVVRYLEHVFGLRVDVADLRRDIAMLDGKGAS